MLIEPTTLPPCEAEIERRVVALQAEMVRQGMDYYVCFDPSNIFYLTNFANVVHERPFILIVPASGHPIFLMPKIEQPHVSSASVGSLHLSPYLEFPAPKGEMWFDRIGDVLANHHHVGVESVCPLFIHMNIPGHKRVLDIVDELRMVKSEYEISRLAHTCNLLSEGHQLLLDNCKVGEVALAMEKLVGSTLMAKQLSILPSSNLLCTQFHGVVQVPSVTHDPHNFSKLHELMTAGGPHVTIVAGSANGYGAELERTFFLDSVPEAARKPFDTMLSARALAFELAVPGASMHEVDVRVKELILAAGYSEDCLLHRTGHSFGVTGHEAPFLAEGYHHVIQPNMVFSIEPAIYLRGIGGFRFSDTVLVTETGNKSLTAAPETLEGLTLKG
ncbi:TPA: M24 family metallopeptidase [Pseudomonas aeruginosa]